MCLIFLLEMINLCSEKQFFQGLVQLLFAGAYNITGEKS